MGSHPQVPERYGLFINNEWVEGETGETLESINPSTGEVLTRVPLASTRDVDRAVAAAKAAFPGWKNTPAAERSAMLSAVADKLQARMEEMAMFETLDNGKPIRECMFFDLPMAVDHWRYFAAAGRMLHGDSYDLNPTTTALTYREPLGVVGAVIPWNFPLLMATWKLAPALAAGNTVVLKPAEQTPITALELCRTLQEVLPPGVVNVITGDGPTTGASLVSHPDVRKVTFTGETNTGRKIMAAAAQNITPVTLELGGKSPNIIFPDAPLEQAVEGVFLSIFFNQGQVCTAGSRLFVHKSIKNQFLEKVMEKANQLVVGDPTQMTTTMGPLVSAEQHEKVSHYARLGREEGATLLLGGQRPAGLSQGFFWSPTVFDNCTMDMKIAQEEVFGPFLSVIPWEDEETMIQQANSINYGLGAAVWTRDVRNAHLTARRLEAGTVWVNAYNMLFNGVPFGGFKQSGFGRELAFETLYHFTQPKSVIINLLDKPLGLY